jgi:hypothetical protein
MQKKTVSPKRKAVLPEGKTAKRQKHPKRRCFPSPKGVYSFFS